MVRQQEETELSEKKWKEKNKTTTEKEVEMKGAQNTHGTDKRKFKQIK